MDHKSIGFLNPVDDEDQSPVGGLNR